MTENNGALTIAKKSDLALTEVPRTMIEQAVAELRYIIPAAAKMPPQVLWLLAQTGLAYDLDPANKELYLLVGKDDRPLGVMVGIAGWRRKAQEQSPFMTEFQDLDDGEKADIRYKPGDVAKKCFLWRLDIIQVMGQKTVPFVGYGIVRADEQFGQGGRDMWNRLSRAKKRAEMDALRQAYALRMPKEPRRNPDVQIIGVGEPDDGPEAEAAPPAIAAISENDGEWEGAEVVDAPPATPEPETTAAQQAAAAGVAVPHWADDAARRAKFWAFCNDHDVTQDEARAQLGRAIGKNITSIKEYTGSYDQAMVEVREFANRKADTQAEAEQSSLL